MKTLKEQAESGELMLPEVELELSKLETENTRLRRERNEWQNNHRSEVCAKRNLSAKYGAIMAKKPGARYRRNKKRLKRSVTKITYKLVGIR